MNTKEKSESIRAAKAAYARAYRAAHPDRVKAANDRYWLRRAEKLLSGSKPVQKEGASNV